MRQYFDKVIRNYTDYGLYVTAKKILSTLVGPIYLSRKYRVYSLDVANFDAPILKLKNIIIRKINFDEKDIILQIEKMEEWLRGKLKESFKNKCLCVAALDGTQLVGFNLISFGESYIPLIQKKRILKADEAWSDQITVLKLYRGRGLGKAIRSTAIKELQKMGISTLYGGTLRDNYSSLGLARSLGFEEILDIDFFKILGKKKWKNRKVLSETNATP